MSSSKRYPEEFKIEAVKQVTEKGHSVAEVASRLGTTTHSLYAWIKRYDPQQPKITDTTQDIYSSADLWTDDVMKNAGFRGAWAELKQTYRLPDNLIPLANKFAEMFLPQDKVIKSEPKRTLQDSFDFGTIEESALVWDNLEVLDSSTFLNVFKKFRNEVIKLQLSNADITILVQTHEIGMSVCKDLLDSLGLNCIDIFSNDPAISRQKKMWFFKGDTRIKVCTVHSFKGWEAKALLVVWDKMYSEKEYALLYTAITRLKSGRSSILYVANAEPSLIEYSKLWKNIV